MGKVAARVQKLASRRAPALVVVVAVVAAKVAQKQRRSDSWLWNEQDCYCPWHCLWCARIRHRGSICSVVLALATCPLRTCIDPLGDDEEESPHSITAVRLGGMRETSPQILAVPLGLLGMIGLGPTPAFAIHTPHVLTYVSSSTWGFILDYLVLLFFSTLNSPTFVVTASSPLIPRRSVDCSRVF